MADRYLIQDTLVAWYGSLQRGRKLQGLTIFTQTTDTFNPSEAANKFKAWLVCSQTASGVASELVANGPAGCFDPLMFDYGPWFDAGNLIACPVWEYQVCPSPQVSDEIAYSPGQSPPHLPTIIKKLGL